MIDWDQVTYDELNVLMVMMDYDEDMNDHCFNLPSCMFDLLDWCCYGLEMWIILRIMMSGCVLEAR